jgi:hypothetical protein
VSSGEGGEVGSISTSLCDSDPECIVLVFDGENRHRIAKVIGVMAKAGGGRIDFQLVSETALSGEIREG